MDYPNSYNNVSPSASDQPPPQYSPLPTQPLSSNFKPIVIPQVKKCFSGGISSPFIRAYSPILQDSRINISRTEFLTFLDGLNEVFIANPVLQATGIAGTVMGMIHPVEIVGMAIEVASEAGSEATSYFRTRAYLKKSNEKVFRPKGLGVKILGFEKMAEKIGVHSQRLRWRMERGRQIIGCEDDGEVDLQYLEPVVADVGGTGAGTEVPEGRPRLQLLQALEEFVAPLEMGNLPVLSEQSNMLKRWNASFTVREEKKQNEELDKKYREARERQTEKYQEAIHEARKKDKEIARIEGKIATIQARPAKDEGEVWKKIDRLTSEMEKIQTRKRERMSDLVRRGNEDLDRMQKKELEAMIKVKWLVIFPLDRMGLADEDVGG
ncbi:hypothetical protein BDW59DRAFT_159019 [Aspergillus cavernicola]|uniref:Uncharacterized protein n=1 Tax=Aspergillus cavernicola TaxID=176166 RepID=A0ABR4INW8_9EURO